MFQTMDCCVSTNGYVEISSKVQQTEALFEEQNDVLGLNFILSGL